MDLSMAGPAYREMVEATRAELPNEACGLLAGTGQRITDCYVLTNADASPDHYSMIPDEQFAAVRDIRKRGLRLLGIWHSHPGAPACFSDEDLRLAYTPEIAYVIFSPVDPEDPEIRGYRVENGTPREIRVTVAE